MGMYPYTNMKKFCMQRISAGHSQWITSKVTDMDLMFYECKILTETSAWDVSGVTSICGMFGKPYF